MSEPLKKAIMFHKQGRLNEAETHYLEALTENFDDMDALYLLGTVKMQNGQYGLAANLLKQALMLKSDHFEAWNNLGNCFKLVNKEIDAKECFKKGLSIEGKSTADYADIYNNLGALYINAGCPEEGMSYLDKAIEFEKNHTDANWNRALLCLEQGMYEEGFKGYEWGFKTKNRMYKEYGREIPYWDGSPNRTIVVWGEQGIGDEILFASMIPDLLKISKKVVFDCHPRLVGIFKESFPDVTVYGTRKDTYMSWPSKHPDIDARVAIGDLGRYFRKDLNSFPQHEGYLNSSPERIAHYRKKLAKLGNRIKIGISWTGGYTKTRKDYRSIPLELWESLFRLNADFISLQYTPEAYNTIADVEDKFDARIHHWPSAVQNHDYGETAALVAALDLIITVNTSIHHLAGALGQPCWTLTPKGKAWRYWSPDGVSNPWYPSVTQIEQSKIGEWGDVLEKVIRNLNDLCSHKKVI